MENVAHALREEYGALEKDMQVSLPGSARDGHVPAVLSRESENKLLTLLRVLPHGVIKFSHHVPGRAPLALLATVAVLKSAVLSRSGRSKI